jgi:hypothetical protein
MFEVAEYLREEVFANYKVGPRRYEHWEITVVRELEKNDVSWKWELSAKWILRRSPDENATGWLIDLADEVSKRKTGLFKTQNGVVKFLWTEEGSDERKRDDRTSQPDACRDLEEEEDSGDLAGEISLLDEDDDDDE